MTRLKSMSIWATACGLLMAAQSIAFPQSAPLRITGVDEPPELVGPPKKFTPPSDDFRQFFETFPKDEKDAVKVRASIEALTKLLQQHPDYSDGYFMRAMFNRCMLNASDPDAAVKDINTAISTHAAQRFPGAYESLADHYSVRRQLFFPVSDNYFSLSTTITLEVARSAAAAMAGASPPSQPFFGFRVLRGEAGVVVAKRSG
ncbi:MAG: hypothetical protein IT160_10965, partial [Bryobacterales bacterium]|nr:hypothetical protein [Bryobacterales bacterium]